MFTNGMLETDQDVVLIRDIDADVMNSLLDFMYTGQVEITTHNVQSLMQGKIIGILREHSFECQFVIKFLQSSALNCQGTSRLQTR